MLVDRSERTAVNKRAPVWLVRLQPPVYFRRLRLRTSRRTQKKEGSSNIATTIVQQSTLTVPPHCVLRRLERESGALARDLSSQHLLQ